MNLYAMFLQQASKARGLLLAVGRAMRLPKGHASLALLILIGSVDLIATALLHSRGLIIELNPLMRPLIEHSEWTFAAVKSSTLVLAAYVMLEYAKTNPDFVCRACRMGSAAYVTIWTVWFLAAM
jgi:hypothetical protein